MNYELKYYLNDFYNDPKNVEEYKIIFLKKHYYPKINVILNTKFKNFKIGITKKNINILYFINKNKPNNEVIYNIKNEEIFIKNKLRNILQRIDYNSYNNLKKKRNINKTCCKICILC